MIWGCIGLYWVISAYVGLYWVIWGYIGLCWVILGYIGLYRGHVVWKLTCHVKSRVQQFRAWGGLVDARNYVDKFKPPQSTNERGLM